MIYKNAELCKEHRPTIEHIPYVNDVTEFAGFMKELYDSMYWFNSMYGSDEAWDIKRADKWAGQLPGIPYLGLRDVFIFNGRLQHAEGMGNVAFRRARTR